MIQVFTDINALYNDMITNCKYFTLGISENTDINELAAFGETVFSNYEFQDCSFQLGNNELRFWQTGNSDGANLYLNNVVKGERVSNSDKDKMFEYRFWLKDKSKPFVMLAFGWCKEYNPV